MADKKTLTFALMDAPFESARTITALRLIDAAVRAGHDVTVFAYEGAVALAFARQVAHPNPVHGRSAPEENHLLTKDLVGALLEAARNRGTKLDWINCGLCVDERGVEDSVPGVRRGSPADFWKLAAASDNTLVVGTRG